MLSKGVRLVGVVEGWAYGNPEIREYRKKRYEEIKDSKMIEIVDSVSRYSKKIYTGNILCTKATDEDILLLCDRGNTCFGGKVNRMRNLVTGKPTFEATVYTD